MERLPLLVRPRVEELGRTDRRRFLLLALLGDTEGVFEAETASTSDDIWRGGMWILLGGVAVILPERLKINISQEEDCSDDTWSVETRRLRNASRLTSTSVD